MKDSATLPLVYILLVALLLVLVCGFQLLFRWGMAYNPQVALPATWFVSQASAVFMSSVPVSALGALFLLFPRIARRPGNRLLSFIGPLLTCIVIVTGGALLANRLCASGVCEGPTVTRPLLAKTIHPLSDGELYAEQVDYADEGPSVSDTSKTTTAELHDVVAADIPASTSALSTLLGRGPAGMVPIAGQGELNPVKGQVLRYAATGKLDASNDGVHDTVTLSDGSSMPVSPPNPAYAAIFTPPSYLKGLFDDVGVLNGFLYGNLRTSVERLLLAVLAISFLSMSCWIFPRLTRWPLFNVCVTLAVFRGVLVLLRLVTSDLARELLALAPDAQMAGAVPSFALIALAVLLFIIDLLFVPYGRKRESAAHG